MWAGPHHLHYTALPDWAQIAGHGVLADPAGAVVGRHDQRHHDAVGRRGTSCAPIRSSSSSSWRSRSTACATFEGPMMSIKTVNSLVALHRLDRRPRARGRARLGGDDLHRLASTRCCRGCCGMQEMYSIKLDRLHFWLHTVGVVLYIASMWIAGVMQGLMWRATNRRRHADLRVRRSAQRHLPVLRGAPLGGGADRARRHVRHGLELWKTFRLAAASTEPQPLLAPDAADARA